VKRWVEAPSPLEAHRLDGVDVLWLKRDDRIPALLGGTKVRKLAVLLATEPWASARGWVSSGAIGSGQLACLAQAAAELGRELHAHVFWEPPTRHVRENLAIVACHAASLTFYRSRLNLALLAPWLLRPGRRGDLAVIPPGATTAESLAALHDAAAELAAQLPAEGGPDALYVALGSGGTAAGLAAGLRRAGVHLEVRAIAAVEWPLSARARLRSLAGDGAAPLSVDRRHVGPGYAVPTPGAWAAVEALEALGVAAEPAYLGKAMAAVLADAAAGRTRRPLLWVTGRRPAAAIEAGWEARLPPGLARKLADAPLVGPDHHLPGRRGLLLAMMAAAAALVAVRTGGYRAFPAWRGEALAAWQAEVLRAAAEAVLPPADPATLDAVVVAADRWVARLPPGTRTEVHGLFALVEQATLPGGHVSRFSRLNPEGRIEALEGLASLGGLLPVAVRGLRDLALLGWYQRDESWKELGYSGPIVGREARPSPYDGLRAPPGTLPRAAS
jgi:D-cysteine desulfhydrase